MAQFSGKQIRNTTIAPAKLLTASQTFDFSGATSLKVPTTGADANSAATRTFVESAISGLKWRNPVEVLKLIGNYTIVNINGLSPAAGDAVVATDAGTPTAGTSDALVAGSLAEFDGTSWKEIVAGAGGFVADGVRALITTGTPATPYASPADRGKLVDFDGTSLTGDDTGEATDESACLVGGDGSYHENTGYVFEGTVPTGTWVQFTGAGQITAGDGLTISGNTISAKPDVTTGGTVVPIDVSDNGLGLDVSDIDGTGIEASGQTLRLATQGNGIDGGAGSTLSVRADATPAANIQPVNVDADGVGVDIDAIAGTGLEADGAANLRVKPDVTTGGNIAPVDAVANGVGLDVSDIAGTGIEADGSANLRLAAQGNGIAGGAGSVLSVDVDSETAGNIQPVNLTANGVGVDISAIAGTGIEADGSANLRLAAQGNGIAGGAGSTLSVQADTSGSVVVGAGGVKAAMPSTADKHRASAVTTGDGQTTALAISATPNGDGYVQIMVNGIQAELGDGVKTKDCYFSADAGSTARTIAAIVATDVLYWNGVVAGYDLATDDYIDMNYNYVA